MSGNLSNPPSGNERETSVCSDPPRIAVTVGDVAGVGPELALKAVADPEIKARCRPELVGPVSVLQRVAGEMDLPLPDRICDVGDVRSDEVRPGCFDAKTGLASFEAVRHACDLTLSGRANAMVTGPIQKEAWHLAGVPWPGHTELLAHQTNTADVRMMLTSPEISCVLVTIHVALADVPSLLNVESVTQSIRLAGQTMEARLGRPARITVCGLNPHAGEQGLFGHGEEERIIEPAVQVCRQEGMQVTGPLPPDTAFVSHQREATDVYVCMYHDQGLIPLKALAFDDAVNVTLGLPITRTSVDHGTAMDLAWKGLASEGSFLAAMHMAVDLARSAPVGEQDAC